MHSNNVTSNGFTLVPPSKGIKVGGLSSPLLEDVSLVANLSAENVFSSSNLPTQGEIGKARDAIERMLIVPTHNLREGTKILIDQTQFPDRVKYHPLSNPSPHFIVNCSAIYPDQTTLFQVGMGFQFAITPKKNDFWKSEGFFDCTGVVLKERKPNGTPEQFSLSHIQQISFRQFPDFLRLLEKEFPSKERIGIVSYNYAHTSRKGFDFFRRAQAISDRFPLRLLFIPTMGLDSSREIFVSPKAIILKSFYPNSKSNYHEKARTEISIFLWE